MEDPREVEARKLIEFALRYINFYTMKVSTGEVTYRCSMCAGIGPNTADIQHEEGCNVKQSLDLAHQLYMDVMKTELDDRRHWECTHPGCRSHVSHPCEGCGRQWR